MKVKTISTVSVALLISSLIVGCTNNPLLSNPLPEKRYLEFGTFQAELEKCFEKGAISPKFYAKTKTALSHVLRSWNVDSNRLSSVSKSHYSKTNPTPQTCRKVEAFSHQTISAAARKSATANANRKASIRNYNNTLNQIQNNRTIRCTRIGMMTTCN